MRFEDFPPYKGGDPIILLFQVPSTSIGYLSSLVEACEGIGLVRTLDEGRGIIECWTMPDSHRDFMSLMEAFGKEYPVQPLDREFD